MATILIQATPGVIPEGFCPSGDAFWQQVYDMFTALTQWSLAAGQTFYNYGNVVPTPENRVYPWIRVVGGYPDRQYDYAGGNWLSKHPLPPGATIIAPASLTSAALVSTWDEGEVGAVGPYTGPFWEIDPEFEGRVPMGAGAVPGSSPALTVAVGEAPGAGSHLLTQAELPLNLSLSATLRGHRFNEESLQPTILAPPGTGVTKVTNPQTEVGNFPFVNTGGGVTPLSLLPPVRVRYLIRRTNRLHYRV